MGRLNITSVGLYVKQQSGTDEFGRPVYTETLETVPGCVVGTFAQANAAQDISNEMNLSGHRIVWQIFIPKGDTHTWENADVCIRGQRFRVTGVPVQAFVDMPHIPCDKLVSVEAYE